MDAISEVVAVPKHICIFIYFFNIPVVYLCLSIGQTSPVKSLKPVSRKISLPISLLLFPTGTHPAIAFKSILSFSLTSKPLLHRIK